MALLTKTKYIHFLQCPKMLWLDVHKPEEAVIPPETRQKLDNGNAAGDLAMGYFGKYLEATTYKEDGKLDFAAMLQKTKEWIAEGQETVCEAAFSAYGMYCAADILHKTESAYDLYEVKNTVCMHEVFLPDVAFQRYVIESAGVKIGKCYVLHTRAGKEDSLDAQERFVAEDVTAAVRALRRGMFERVQNARAVAGGEEPQIPCGEQCEYPYGCFYKEYCQKYKL